MPFIPVFALRNEDTPLQQRQRTRVRFSAIKSQSAMEYLMTYGWAILVIALVLGVLFQLGVFGSASLAPKATAGSCQVQALGSGSSTTHQLAGMCQGEEPQYVAQFTEPVSGGSAEYVRVPNSQSLTIPTGSNMTISAWVEVNAQQSSGFVNSFWDIGFDCAWPEGELRNNEYSVEMVRGSNQEMFQSYTTGQWYNYIGTYSSNALSNTVYLYTDGKSSGGGVAGSSITITRNVIIGLCANIGAINSMYLSNVQIYNTTLSQAEITALYQEGIGGAPVAPQYIVGWWPLNGNANDYSGNNNNGQGTGVGYTSFWTSGYSAP